MRVPLRLTATRGRTAFYPTPQPVIDTMLKNVSFSPNLNALEPSAGLEAIAIALRNKGIECDCFELSPLLQVALVKMGFRVLGSDFLAATGTAVYDLVIANPPFSNLGVMKHTLHAMDFLRREWTFDNTCPSLYSRSFSQRRIFLLLAQDV